MHLDRHESAGHDYYYVAQTKRKGAYVDKDRKLYLGRLDNIDETRRLELERKIRDFNDPELMNEFKAKLYSLGYKFPTPFSNLTVEQVQDYGLPLVLHKICCDVGLVGIIDKHGYKGGGPSLGKLTEIMAINKNCEPGSHRELVRWYPTTVLPAYLELPPEQFNYKVTLNALDYLQPEHTVPMQKELYDNIQSVYGYKCNRLDYDLTSTYFEGWKCLLAKLGYSRDHRSDNPQVVIGFVVDQEGILVTHKTWPGNRTDMKALKPLDRLVNNEFGLDCPRVTDRGMASWENIEYMDRKKERYLVALRAGIKATGLLDEIHVPKSKWEDIGEDNVATSVVRGRRKYVVSWNKEVAGTNKKERNLRIEKAEDELKALQKRISEGKIGSREERDQEIGHILKSHRVTRYFGIKGDRKGFGFRFEINAKVEEANIYEGYQIFVTTEIGLTEKEIVVSYRARDEVEKAICSLKNDLGLRPLFVRTEEHVIGQIFVCATAYQLRSIMARELRSKDIKMSVNDAIWKLDQLKVVDILATGDEMQTFRKFTTMDKDQLVLVNTFKLSELDKGLLGVEGGI